MRLQEERKRLDRMRNQKFKIISDAMAQHKIEEHNSEYDESVFNSFAHDPKNSAFDPRLRGLSSHRYSSNTGTRGQRSLSNPPVRIDESGLEDGTDDQVYPKRIKVDDSEKVIVSP